MQLRQKTEGNKDTNKKYGVLFATVSLAYITTMNRFHVLNTLPAFQVMKLYEVFVIYIFFNLLLLVHVIFYTYI